MKLTIEEYKKGIINMFTASEAREFSEYNKHKDEIDYFDREIRRAIHKGDTYISYYGDISSYVEDILKKLGYIINVNAEGDYKWIEW